MDRIELSNFGGYLFQIREEGGHGEWVDMGSVNSWVSRPQDSSLMGKFGGED